MTSVAFVLFLVFSLKSIVSDGSKRDWVTDIGGTTTMLTSSLPTVKKPSVMGICSSFGTVPDIDVSSLDGTYYMVKTTSAHNEAVTACDTLILSTSTVNVGQLNVIWTSFPINLDIQRNQQAIWTSPMSGISTLVEPNDATTSMVISFVAFDPDLGFVAALCPQVTACGLNCGTYILTVFVKDQDATADQIKGLIKKAQSSYVPVSNLIDIKYLNCPAASAANLDSALPVQGANSA